MKWRKSLLSLDCGRLEDGQFLRIERLQVSGYMNCGLEDRQKELFSVCGRTISVVYVCAISAI